MGLDSIFSNENILAYSEACLNLAVDLPENKRREASTSNTLLIPSRGAVPFFLGMLYSLNQLKSFGGDHEKFYERLRIQDTLSSLLPENLEVAHEASGDSVNVLLVPFTADLNLSKFDGSLNDDEFVPKTRNYWANVTRSFFKKPSERVKDPYFISFADFVLKDVEGRGDLANIYEQFPEITRFFLMDTAISGRAATDTIGSFEKLALKDKNPALNPTSYLVVDENGDKLKPSFLRYLNRKKLEGILSMYPIPRIVSEDEGASLLGVAAVVYPSIMRASKHFTLGGEEFFIGAGAWHKSSDLPGKYFDNFGVFMNMVYKGIDFTFGKKYRGEDASKEYGAFVDSREAFLRRAKEVKLLAETSDGVSCLNPTNNYSFGDSYETHSHVLHAPFTEESEWKFTMDLYNKGIPGLKYVGPKHQTPKHK